MSPIYAFVGGGNMGRALIGGLVAGGCPAHRIRVADPDAAARESCAASFDVGVFADAAQAVADADVVVLAVKPQQMREVARGVVGSCGGGALFLSIAAGITCGHLARWLGADRAIVRAMPNTPALVGRGAAVLFANAAVSNAQREHAQALLGAVGSAAWVDDEALMDAVTAVSGSGPAYFFLFMELIEKVAVELGLPAALARELTLDTALGAATLARGASEPPATLRTRVTSPGGTTERALAAFGDGDLQALVRRALVAARDRSVELAQGIER